MVVSKLKPRAPLYSTLGDLQLILDATGLRSNTANLYGTVASATAKNSVTHWNSLAPGPTGRNFAAGSVVTSGSPIKLLDGFCEFSGGAHMTSQSAAGTWDFMSHPSTTKYTVHMVVKLGINDVPNWQYGLFGNNAGSSANKGTSTWYNDRIGASRSDGLTSFFTAGGAGVVIILSTPDNLITPNVPFVYTEETDLTQAAASRRKHYINDVLFAYSVTSTSTATVTGPNATLSIGGVGETAIPLCGWVSHVVIQSRIETSGVRSAFAQSLLPFTRKKGNQFYRTDETRIYSVYHTLAGAGRYYFGQGLIQNPQNPNEIIKIYHDGDTHLEADDKKVAQQTSTDMGRTWGAQVDTYDDDGPGTWAVQDGEWGWTADINRIHGITDWHTEIALTTGTHKLLYHYSDNGGTSYTTIDITSVVPADGLVTYRAHGNIIEGGDGFIYACLYKLTDELNTTQSSLYLLRKPVGTSTTWTALTVRAPSAGYRNETAIAALNSTTLLILVRDDVTQEWHQYRATNNGTTITDDGAVSFGETLVSAGPPVLTTFNIYVNGVATLVVAAWILDRDNERLKVVYGLASSLASSGASGWTLSTKTTIATDTQVLHYGKFCHYNNTMNAIGIIVRDPFTLVDNTLVTFHCPSTQFAAVKAALGL